MKQVLVICYPNDWHWVLSLEFVSAHLGESPEIEVWDLTRVGESGLRSRVKQVIGGNSFQRACRNWLKAQDIEFRDYRFPYLKFTSVRKQLRKIISEYHYLDFETHRTIYNTVVENVGNLRVDTKKYKRIIKHQLRAMTCMNKALGELAQGDIVQFITVNGRFTKNATVRDWSKLRKIPVVLLEFGSTENSFEEFHVSPHSVSEVTAKIVEHWNQAVDLTRINKAKSYLDAIAKNEVSKIMWRARMKDDSLPIFPKDKKICVFFASTESEEAGLGDAVRPGNFTSQVEAFRGLIEVLPMNEWHIFLRRHPRNPMTTTGIDPEEHLWDEFLDKSNVTTIEPDSAIDSISLGMQADLVTNYWSGIAIELLIKGQNKVLTLGDAPWNYFLPSNTARNPLEIAEFLRKPEPKFEIKSLYPWAYYYSTFGKPFDLFKFEDHLARWVKNF